MINESKQNKPDCPLIGQDGNNFNLVGIASRTLKRNGLSDEASEIADLKQCEAAEREFEGSPCDEIRKARFGFRQIGNFQRILIC